MENRRSLILVWSLDSQECKDKENKLRISGLFDFLSNQLKLISNLLK